MAGEKLSWVEISMSGGKTGLGANVMNSLKHIEFELWSDIPMSVLDDG